MTIRICPRSRGPLVVEVGDNPVEIEGLDGRPMKRPEGTKLYLCRCGASSNKPLCDGSHNRIGLEAPPAAEGEPSE